MDYEKLHKDTIAKLQEMVNSGKITVKVARGICADFIPEGEDERIRKGIIKYLRQRVDRSSSVPAAIGSWIDWLEKQGEQNLIMAKSPQLGKQKPAEDSCKKSDGITSEEKDMTEYNKGFECGKQRVLKYPKDFDLCKKPAWSEADEEMFDAVIADIQFTQKAHNHEVNQIVYEREIDWLKSLKARYIWKPSDEQIKSLEEVIDAGHYTSYPFALETLYNNLKKLREK